MRPHSPDDATSYGVIGPFSNVIGYEKIELHGASVVCSCAETGFGERQMGSCPWWCRAAEELEVGGGRSNEMFLSAFETGGTARESVIDRLKQRRSAFAGKTPSEIYDTQVMRKKLTL